jgi:hypothetical protein
VNVPDVGHLVRRWWRVVRARPPGPQDEAWVDSVLLPGERTLWIALDDADRAHAIHVARRFECFAPGADRPAMAAALLHDVGKVDAGLGTTGRIIATLTGPRWRRARIYHDHERRGASHLERVGSADLTVQLVRGGSSVPGELADALRRADDI